ncbi:hypothetical protein ACIRQY_12020 [Streptomyces sp. NPDC101490]|uniref:hypothetical protein n=2 Tax=unclassified Streptomyces TaxID=2593676 RepID=UPI00381401D1
MRMPVRPTVRFLVTGAALAVGWGLITPHAPGAPATLAAPAPAAASWGFGVMADDHPELGDLPWTR